MPAKQNLFPSSVTRHAFDRYSNPNNKLEYRKMRKAEAQERLKAQLSAAAEERDRQKRDIQIERARRTLQLAELGAKLGFNAGLLYSDKPYAAPSRRAVDHMNRMARRRPMD